MANQQANLPSTAFKEGRRGNIAIVNIANDDKNKLEHNMARIEKHGQLSEEDLKELQNQGEKMVRGKTNKNSEATYKCYQNLFSTRTKSTTRTK